MTPRKLYMFPASPPVRAVLMVAKAIGLELEIKEIDILGGENFQPYYLKMNPQHSVPTLLDGDFAIWDSHAIIPYLIAKYAKDDNLHPKDPQKRAVIDQRLHFENGVIFSRGRRITFPIVFKGKKTIDQPDVDHVLEGIAFLNTFLELSEWVAGDSITVVDYSLFATVSSFNSIVPLDEKKFPKVIAWLKKMEPLPACQENVKGLAMFTGMIQSSLMNV